MSATKMKTTSLNWGARLGYGAGDLGLNLFWSTLEFYLLFYYTDIIGLPSTTAGLIFLFAMIWDGLTDPIMGFVADARKASKLGKYRPFIRYGSLPLAVSFIALFYQPSFEGGALVAYVFGAHVLFRSAYTVVSVPYSSLSARMTSSSMERNFLAACRMVCAATGGLSVAIVTPALAEALGQGNQITGFFGVGLIYAGLALVILNISVQFSPEQPQSSNLAKTGRLSLSQAWESVRSNWPFWIVLSAMLLSQMGGVFMSKVLVYFMKYNVGREDLMGAALGGMIASVTLFIPFWSWITTKTSKRVVWIAGGIISAFAYLTIFFMSSGSGIAVAWLMLLLAINGMGRAANVLTIWSMLGDTVEYGQWVTKIRSEAANFGLVSLAQKLAVGIAAAILGFALDWIGFVPNQPQSADSLRGLTVLMTIVPLGLVVTSCFLISFYPINKKMHDRLVKILSRRER